MPKAERFDASGLGLSRELVKALYTLWTIEGEQGFWIYRIGCRANREPTPGCVVAEIGGATAMFERVVKLEEKLVDQIGVVPVSL